MPPRFPDPAWPTSPRILLLDDDGAYAGQLAAYLEAHGCIVRAALTVAEFDRELGGFRPDLVLLDQRLGEITGTEVLRGLRARTRVPCIVVTGLSDTTDRIVNLELGADDEIEKSAPPRELLARIRAVLRRHGEHAAPGAEDTVGWGGGWVLSLARRELRQPDGTPCPLTTAEFEMLRLLVESAGVPVSRATLCERVFGRRHEPSDRAVDTVVRKLRYKILDRGGDPAIRTVRPVGYVFVGTSPPPGREEAA